MFIGYYQTFDVKVILVEGYVMYLVLYGLLRTTVS